MSQNHPPRSACEATDARDPLAPLRELFQLPPDVIYLDGNSLGALPRATETRMREAITSEWGNGLIRSWNDAGWIHKAHTIGAAIAPIIGAATEDVVACDSTSVNLFKVLAAALRIQAIHRPERTLIVSERSNFPTDLYIVQGVAEFLNSDAGSGYALCLVETPSELEAALQRNPAVVLLTHVNYRTGAMYDMAGITRRVRQQGALMIWDLAHSAGAVPLDLAQCDADFAVGCGYKYLNGGPGAPAFVWVAKRHQDATSQPLTGWFSHATPFTFEPTYAPAAGITRYLCGTPSILAMTALECGVSTLHAANRYGGMTALREKSVALCELFIRLVDGYASTYGLELASPRSARERGSQVSYQAGAGLSCGYPVMQALIKAGVIGDFRAPNLLRFGFTPLYTRFVDVWDAAHVLRGILDARSWDRPEFHKLGAVT